MTTLTSDQVIATHTLAALQEAITVATSSQPVELPEPDKEVQPYAQVINGVLIVITRDENNFVHTYAESEFCVIVAEMAQSQALIASQYIINQAAGAHR